MITEFSIKNFLSYKDKVTFSMLASSSEEHKDNYVIISDRKILKTAAIYGANASGKTNLFKILTSIILMIRNSNNMTAEAKLPIIPFKLDKKSIDEPSEFEIKFITNGIRYVYGFIANKDRIFEEYLYYYPNGKESVIFSRVDKAYMFKREDESFLKPIIDKTPENRFFITSATYLNYERSRDAFNFFNKTFNTMTDLTELHGEAFYKYFNDNDHKLKKFALEYLKKSDLNIEDFKIEKILVPKTILNVPSNIKDNLPDNVELYGVKFKHFGSNDYLDIEEESEGTKILFDFLPYLCNMVNNESILLIDELDRSLHPYLVEMIVKIFNDSEINKSNSQLIFNTHDTNLLNLNVLRKDQIWFTEKNNETSISDLYSLNDFAIKSSENVEKGYLLGRYGAIPFINNDISLW